LDKCDYVKTSAWYRWVAKECRLSCKFCVPSATIPPPTKKYVPPTNCGKTQTGRVVGGSIALPGSWPWIARLYEGGKSKSYCGGALVAPNWIVTASHCVFGDSADVIDIHLGRHNIDRTRHNDSSVQIIRAKRVIVHPDFAYPSRMNNDIALVELSRPAVLNDRVKTVCLPRDNDILPVGQKCVLAGWGKTSHPGSASLLLRQVGLEIVDNTICKRLNQRHYRIPVTKNMLCAGLGPDKIQAACHGDSGGPLMCQSNGRFFLHGAVSWGPSNCKSEKAYSVFAQVSLYRKWIDSYINN